MTARATERSDALLNTLDDIQAGALSGGPTDETALAMLRAATAYLGADGSPRPSVPRHDPRLIECANHVTRHLDDLENRCELGLATIGHTIIMAFNCGAQHAVNCGRILATIAAEQEPDRDTMTDIPEETF